MRLGGLAGRQLFAGVVGNALERYDFAIYGFLAPVLGRAFFPSDDPVSSLLAAYGVLAAGYLSRPLGSVLFGHIGDRIGRKPALMLPPRVRCSGAGIGYNSCMALFGGATPWMATYLVERTGDDFAPARYIMAAAAVACIAVLRLPETAGRPLQAVPLPISSHASS